ncbi:ATP-binding protein [Streptomyces sp. HPF1205]|uniref:ATP-binding protein n=1 Tax=Streptomyces sp. HPF1205 TaxID=2873262 RepID=UPI001CEDA119|nr:ATP-binding protein [Streptomyces sp. HPF1205]
MTTSTGSGPTLLSGPRTGAVAGAGAGMVFDGETASIAASRAFTAGFLEQAAAEHGVRVPRQAAADAQLVVSELVTNAVKYAAGLCAVRLVVRDRLLEITVWDTEPTMPEPRGPEPGRIGHHGLEVVLALCESFEAHRDPFGKHVTACLALGPAAVPEGQAVVPGGRAKTRATAPARGVPAAGKTAPDPA